ncbi:hypothetical protein M408DRAFT_325698 [Serendipita vermifera MAFF 305830]|uniref:Secreted protein n=1 Tax=Serendipita vermifera MAFF 305830 TaxID=933852 RepID=A0A0C3BS82_SERVB|nr:hypothetical protein M408DRAFT_325698 [Serendipita vermifera MAFF 305830]
MNCVYSVLGQIGVTVVASVWLGVDCCARSGSNHRILVGCWKRTYLKYKLSLCFKNSCRKGWTDQCNATVVTSGMP